MINKKKEMVEVTWIDITEKSYGDGESLPTDWTTALSTVKEYGFILHKDDKVTVLAKETHDDRPSTCTVIPNSNVLKIKIIGVLVFSFAS